jgi:uncharacterized membrane protein YadS
MKIMPSPLWILPAALGLAGCSRDPSLEISGSFFPAWLASILIGILLTILAQRIFVASGINPYLRPPLLIYGALMLGVTLAVWLLLYS